MSTRKGTSKKALINFDVSPKQAFRRSFWHGLAPNSLFVERLFDIPNKVVRIEVNTKPVVDALASDWTALGRDFSVIIQKQHGKSSDARK